MADRNPPPLEAEPAEPVPPQTSEGADPAPAPEARRWSPPRPGRLGLAAILLLVIAALVAILAAWRIGPFGGATESTENAYVRGKVTIVSPQVSGYVVEVPVKDFATVKAGDVLARIDDRIYRQRVEQARANVATARAALADNPQQAAAHEATLRSQQAAIDAAGAQLARAKADNARIEELARQGFVANRERDASRAALRQAQADLRQAEAARTIAEEGIQSVEVGRGGLQAGVEGAQAALRLAEIDLANAVIRAPVAGELGEIGVREGQYVTAGTQLMSLVPHDLWVIANFKEAQTARIRPGATARIRVDALGGERLNGHVEQLAPAAGSEFAVIRPDNASGNFVKIPQRIAVRIRIDPDQEAAARLRPGMSVEAEVDLAP